MHRAHVINIRKGRSYRSEGPDSPAHDDLPEALTAENQES